VRILAVSILALFVPLVQAQQTQGTYHPDPKTSVSWTINDHSTLIWDGKPYLPVGSIVDSAAAVDRATSAGVNDFVVDLPASGAGWEQMFNSLIQHQSRFLLRINSLEPMSQGVAVEPQGYRFAGIRDTQVIHASLPGVQSALVVVAMRRDGSITQSARVPVVDGMLDYSVDAPGGLERVALIYPITTSAQLPDYWESLDRHRDSLLQSLVRHAPGPGLRGIVDPLGRTLVLPGKELRFVPTSVFFQNELRDYLIDQYKSLETAQRIWALAANDLKDFDVMSRLIPLWSGTRGVSQLWDPQTDRLYACDNRRSKVWSDITAVVESAGARRYLRIVKDLHDSVDVPVVQQWSGWASAYETPTPSLDGIGMRTMGATPSAIFETAGRSTSSLLRWKRPGWLPATEVDMGAGADYSQLPAVLDDVTGIGARGVFFRAETPVALKAVAAAGLSPTLPGLADVSPKAVFFPENALNPASIMRLNGGSWWLPSPMDGDRVDLGDRYSAYRYTDNGKKVFAIFSSKPGRVKLMITKPKLATLTSLDGSELNVKIDKTILEFSISSTPTIITGLEEVPVPEDAYKETILHFEALSDLLQRNHMDAPDQVYSFRDAMSQATENPGAAFTHMRQALRSLSAMMGRFFWVEAESCRDHNFSEIDLSPACSAGAALALRTQMPPGPDGYFANFTVPTKTNDDQEVWIAARIPADRRGDVRLVIGGQLDASTGKVVGTGQTLTINSEPVSLYGNGFGWYKLGVTRLAGANSLLRFLVTGDTPSDLALDAILFTPTPFHPNGVNQPDAIDFSKQLAPSKKKGSKTRARPGSQSIG
jgi:hypothetical protein